MKKLLLAALSSLAMGAYAADDHKFYAGAGISAIKMDLDSDWATGTFNATTIDAVAGYKVLPWLNIEGKFGVGVEGELETVTFYDDFTTIDDITLVAATPGTPADPATGAEAILGTEAETSPAFTSSYAKRAIKAEVNYMASLHLKPQVKNDVAAFYGLAGITIIDADINSSNSVSITDTYLGIVTDLDNAELYSAGQPAVASDSYQTTLSEVYPSLGLGVSFYFDQWTLNTEWVRIIGSDDIEEDSRLGFTKSALSMNLTYSF